MRIQSVECVFDIGEDFVEHIKQMKNMGFEAINITRYSHHVEVIYEQREKIDHPWIKYKSAFYERIIPKRGDL